LSRKYPGIPPGGCEEYAKNDVFPEDARSNENRLKYLVINIEVPGHVLNQEKYPQIDAEIQAEYSTGKKIHDHAENGHQEEAPPVTQPETQEDNERNQKIVEEIVKQRKCQDGCLRKDCGEAEYQVNAEGNHFIPFGDILAGISKAPIRPGGWGMPEYWSDGMVEC
jgi:hypothetical protein